jgi:hypothetical protein
MKFKIVCSLLTVLFLFMGSSYVLAESGKPLKFKCKDGRVFTIQFQGTTTAKFKFSNSKKVEIFESDPVASGISYGNEKYNFREHRDDVTLTDYTKKGKNNMDYETPCRKIK